jgi:hypothetical protein
MPSDDLLQMLMIVLLAGKKRMTGISACGSEGNAAKRYVMVRYDVAV